MKHSLFRILHAIAAIAAIALFLSPAMVQATAPEATARNLTVASAERRVALVIGNNAYQNVTRLNNAVGDAKAMAQELRGLGFDVIERHDVDQRNMKVALREFVQRIGNGGVGAFFYAGHGVQEGGNNFLLPVDVGALSDPAALPDEAIELNGDVMARIGQSGAKFSLLIIDACRDNPFPKRSGRSVGATRGLTAAASAPEGMVVVYSAGVGQQALDRLGEGDRDPNGLFTREFIREIRKPGLEVSEVVMNVRKRVKDLAAQVKHEQTPAIYIQADRFYLTAAGQSSPAEVPPLPAVVAPEAAAVVPVDAETQLWNRARSDGRRAQFLAYLRKHADGRYAAAARAELKRLDDRERQQAVKEEAEREKKLEFARGEKEAWERAKANDSKKAYAAYLETYPKGRFTALARIALSKASIAGN